MPLRMTPWRRQPREVVRPPGDDVVPVPRPVTEEPPRDRFCDLVLTGGVASGVVYPWAVVELARHYRFRNIGGSSVGAMAAALAAAAEYGRRTGFEAPFEALRRSPASLAFELKDGRTRMLSLFQTNPHGRRLIGIWGRAFCGANLEKNNRLSSSGSRPSFRWIARLVLTAYLEPFAFGVLAVSGIALLVAAVARSWHFSVGAWVATGIVAVLTGLASLGRSLWMDVRRGIAENSYGLCKGGTTEPSEGCEPITGISDWLHDGIQESAGLDVNDRPLTFRDLWCAPDRPGDPHKACGPDDPPRDRAINLEMMTTSVTHGRPYRLPLNDPVSRLFFRPCELEGFFPDVVIQALIEASKPYAPKNPVDDGREPRAGEPSTTDLLELPGADLPVVVAARMSLSFPLLFSAMPLWAVDFEAPRWQRVMRRCLFTDGGVSSNFPIHLFDAAVPRWPTFGMWLDERGPYQRSSQSGRRNAAETVWLPEFNDQGYGDSWQRFDPGSKVPPPDGWPKEPAPSLPGFLAAVLASAKDWHDRTIFRLPHVRNRVARLLLKPLEGGLHIGMPREQILKMADEYGTVAGRLFVERFRDRDGEPSRAWNEQRWIRFNVMVNGLRDALHGLREGAEWSARTRPMCDAIRAASGPPGPVKGHDGRISLGARLARDDRMNGEISGRCADELEDILRKLERLEAELGATKPAFASAPDPELRLRAPL